jgi:hypothetical protein
MTTPKPKPKRQTWTKAQQKSLKAWEKKHPFPPGAFKPSPHRTTHVNHGGGFYPGYPMIPARGGGGRHGKGRHGLAQPGALPLCASLAAAESLLAATGTAAGEDDLLRLHEAAGGDADGASVAGVLAALMRGGLAGVRPLSVAEVFPGEGTVVSLRLELAQADQQTWDAGPSPFWGLHAAYLTEGCALTWGRAVPVTEAFLERQALAAWAVTWPGKRAERSVWLSTT